MSRRTDAARFDALAAAERPGTGGPVWPWGPGPPTPAPLGWPGSSFASRPVLERGTRRAPRPPLHDARAGRGARRRDRARLHVLRPPRMARASQGPSSSAGPSGWRPAGRRRSSASARPRRAAGRGLPGGPRWWWRRTGWTTPGSRPPTRRRGPTSGPSAAGCRSGAAVRPLRGHPRAPQGRRHLVRASPGGRWHPDAVLVVAGRRVGRPTTSAGLAAARHADRVVRTGYVPDDAVPALLRPAAVVAYPSLRRGLRPAGPRGPGVRVIPRHHLGHGHGRDGRRRGRAGGTGRRDRLAEALTAAGGRSRGRGAPPARPPDRRRPDVGGQCRGPPGPTAAAATPMAPCGPGAGGSRRI